MTRMLLMVALALSVQGLGRGVGDPEPPPVPPRPTSLRDATFSDLLNEYRRGDANAAVDEVARRPPDSIEPYLSPLGNAAASDESERDRLILLAQALLHTEAGIRRGVFGRYSASAPLVPATPSTGLTGMFELHSLVAYRLMNQVLGGDRANGDVAHTFVRDWYVVTASYCRYENLDCAQALVAAAGRDFPNDAPILLLSGSMAETNGQLTDAAVFFRRALAADPALVEARVRLGRTLLATGRMADAQHELERALDDARAGNEAFSQHVALLSLADLDTRAGRSASATARRTAASAVAPFDIATAAAVGGADIWRVYKAGQYWRVARTSRRCVV